MVLPVPSRYRFFTLPYMYNDRDYGGPDNRFLMISVPPTANFYPQPEETLQQAGDYADKNPDIATS